MKSQGPLRVEKPLRLSEAIREGSKKSKPFTGNLIHRDSEGTLYACALGAAWLTLDENAKEENDDAGYKVLAATWPYLKKVETYNAIADRTEPLIDYIWYRNDHGMSREEVADWLEGLGY